MKGGKLTKIENKFAETFNDLRMEHSVSRAEIATILDVSEATVEFWEREGRKPSFFCIKESLE